MPTSINRVDVRRNVPAYPRTSTPTSELKSTALPAADTAPVIAVIVNRANAAATALADAWLAVQIEQLTGAPVPTFGITATDDAERLSSAVATILASDADTTMQLSRMARAEPLDAAQRATAAPMLDQARVGGWVRQTNARACELCRWWSAGGRVWPKDHSFPRHPGCNCAARIVLTHRENRHG